MRVQDRSQGAFGRIQSWKCSSGGNPEENGKWTYPTKAVEENPDLAGSLRWRRGRSRAKCKEKKKDTEKNGTSID